MSIQVVTSYIAGNSIDITVGFKSIRTGLPADSDTVTVLINLYDPTGLAVVALAPMTFSSFTPPGFWVYTFASSATLSTLGLYSSQYQVTDTAGNVFISTVEPAFVLAVNSQVTSFTGPQSPVVATGTT